MIAALALAPVLLALAGPATVPPPPVDPLTAEIETEDADRFAALFARTGGAPTAEQIQRDYLDRGSYGVHVFTDGRIRDADHLARTVAAKRQLYARAVGECLPVIKQTTGELRATYLALHGLLPAARLPHIFLVVGADNSGGTAGPGAQVLGLETLCRIAATPDALRETMRGFYAHETVHALQDEAAAARANNALLTGIMVEGAADFITTLVTGRQMDAPRAAWAAPRERALWRQLTADLAATRGIADPPAGSPAHAALRRWVGNFGSAPAGWPGELGYWMGQRIWQRWYERQPDKHAAIGRLLTLDRLDEVLAAGAYPG